MTTEIFHRADLYTRGHSRRSIDAQLASGQLIRAHRDHYLWGDTPDPIVRAVRIGGRLTCLSLLVMMEVFVLRNQHLHVHLRSNASRLRSPHNRRKKLEPRMTRGARLHWYPIQDDPGPIAVVSLIDALVHSILCQPPRAAIATIDSALHKGLLAAHEVSELFRRLPSRFSVLEALVDGRAESGPETLLRLMVRSLGCAVEAQAHFPGIGRVDLLVDGWLVIECDSEEFHTGWASQESDRRRDLALAALGLCSLRPTASMIMNEPERVIAAIRGMLSAHA